MAKRNGIGIKNLPALYPRVSATYKNPSAAWDSPKPAHQYLLQKSQVHQTRLRFLPKVKIPMPAIAIRAKAVGSGTAVAFILPENVMRVA